jgi:hypothetical protein
MKNKSLMCSNCRTAARSLLLGIGLLAAVAASAQNYVTNPDFEDPLGPDNWTIVYTAVLNGGANGSTNCGPLDFLVAGRTTMAHRDVHFGSWDGFPTTWSKFGGHFAPNHTWMMHAYFDQVVKGLKPGSNYTVSAWMTLYSDNDNDLTKCYLFLETLGGPGRNVPHTNPTYPVNVLRTPMDGTLDNWRQYSITTPASTNGEIEVQLHFNKIGGGSATTWPWRHQHGFFDHVSVVEAGQTDFQTPYNIVSCIRTNLDFTLTWQTVMNNSYRIQCSKNPSDPASWSYVAWSPYLDTNLYAPGATLTFKTNLANLFSYDPSFNLGAPMFFRIHAQNYQP